MGLLALWLGSVGSDPLEAATRLLDAFFADAWAKSQHYPVQHLAKYPQKYFDPRSEPAKGQVTLESRIRETEAQLKAATLAEDFTQVAVIRSDLKALRRELDDKERKEQLYARR